MANDDAYDVYVMSYVQCVYAWHGYGKQAEVVQWRLTTLRLKHLRAMLLMSSTTVVSASTR